MRGTSRVWAERRGRLWDPLSRGRSQRRLRSVELHLVGLALGIAGLAMLLSGLVETLYAGPNIIPLLAPGTLLAGGGLTLWRLTGVPTPLPKAAVFAAVLWCWLALSLAGAVPFMLSGVLPRFDDALFESVSGFTTTGSTILRPISTVSEGILFWRSITQWMGGIGVVVLAVSVLPFLGVGGMELMTAEAPGPSSERLVPRVRETAKRLVLLYLGFSGAVAGAYLAFGMNLYDAVVHAFTTVSTGGYSPRDGSFGEFDSAALEWTAILAMAIAGGSFALYWRALLGKPFVLVRSVEARAYLFLIVALAAAASTWNVMTDGLSHDVIRQSSFSVISIATSTGYTLLDYNLWPGALQLWLIFAMGLGGMAGSTTGGFKVFRLLSVLSYARRQMFRQLHPRSVEVIRFGRDVVPQEIVSKIIGFFALFMALGAFSTFVVAASGTDPVTAISAVAQSIGNVGPGLGEVGPMSDYLNLPRPGRGMLMLVMVAGRLELFPVFLGLVPLFRRMGRVLPAKLVSRLARMGSG